MRILLTGSSGWLGRHLAPLLCRHGHVVVGLDVASGAHTDVVGTVADRGLVDRIFGEGGIEAVIHAGALHKPDIARYPAQAFVDVNVTGTLNLLEAAAAARHDRSIFTSTKASPTTASSRRSSSVSPASLCAHPPCVSNATMGLPFCHAKAISVSVPPPPASAISSAWPNEGS